jgi:LPXTG-site transpeptidase (sortase) family protein
MVIEKMGVDARIVTLGLDANSRPEMPHDPDLVVWYDFSTKPGQGSNAVFSGHVDWTVNGQPVTAVFWGLRELEEGDLVKLFLEDETELWYRVTQNLAIGYDDPDIVEVMYRTPNDVITLISCGGTWVPDPSTPFGGNYTHRVVVRAERVT